MDIISYDLLQLLEENVFCLTFEDAKQYVDRLKAYILRNRIYDHPSQKENTSNYSPNYSHIIFLTRINALFTAGILNTMAVIIPSAKI